MTWYGGFALGVGLLLVAVLGGRKIHQMLRRRSGRTAGDSYAERLELKAEIGSDDEIDRLARDLVGEHGVGAVIKAARRTLADLDEGDARGRAVWQRVLQAAQDCERRQESENEAAT